MSGLFSGKSKEERQSEKRRAKEHQQEEHRQVAESYASMVHEVFDRLIHWGFPDSQAEESGIGEWQLWHLSDNGKKIVDASVELSFEGDKPAYFWCDHSCEYGGKMVQADLNKDSLLDSLRHAIFG